MAMLGLVDCATGRLWLGPAYLLVIAGAAWLLGWREAAAFTAAAFALVWAVNGHFYGSGTGTFAGDMLVRLAAVGALVTAISALRGMYLREWHRARLDTLTGALNRQAFFEVFASAPPSSSWSLIAYGDLDGFKQINDLCGHHAGDDMLRGFAGAVQRSIRKTDLFARLGGDEFVIFMSIKDQSSAKLLATRLHLAMNSGCKEAAIVARCSLGVLILPPRCDQWTAYLRTADRLMYEAKQSGASLVAATLADPTNPDGLVRHLELSQGRRAAGIQRAELADNLAVA